MEDLRDYSRISEYDGHRYRRSRLFFLVGVGTLIAGLLWTFLQPVIYRSHATVLMAASPSIDAAVAEEDIQNVAIQRAILLGGEVTSKLLDELENLHGIELTRGELRPLLSVESMPETNLVEMVAQGSDAELLPILVNSWVDTYLDLRAKDISESKGSTQLIVQEEVDGLVVKIEEARDALEKYREDNEILSVERQENEVLARLKGLQKALNSAVEEEVKAKAKLDTMREAAQRGDNLIPGEQRRDVGALENELQSLRAQLVELQKRYTMAYINRYPQYRAVPERITELEEELAEIYQQGRQAELRSAEQAYATAGQTVKELEYKLDQHKESVARFNRIYATHQALVDDLARLEQLHREAQSRLVQIQVSRVEKYPQVSVIERPAAEAERVGPNYGLLLGGSVLAALVSGLFAVWLQGFLYPRASTGPHITLSGVHLYPRDVNGELAYTTEPIQRLGGGEKVLLASQETQRKDEQDEDEEEEEDNDTR